MTRGIERLAIATFVAIALAGCTTVTASQTSRYYPDLNTVVIETATVAQARILCEALGADYNRAKARRAADTPTGTPFPNYDGGKYGCYWGRMSDPSHAGVDIIVCPRDDQECLAHEFRHQREGQFHHS